MRKHWSNNHTQLVIKSYYKQTTKDKIYLTDGFLQLFRPFLYKMHCKPIKKNTGTGQSLHNYTILWFYVYAVVSTVVL